MKTFARGTQATMAAASARVASRSGRTKVRVRLVLKDGRCEFCGAVYFEAALFDISPNYAAHLVDSGIAEYA